MNIIISKKNRFSFSSLIIIVLMLSLSISCRQNENSLNNVSGKSRNIEKSGDFSGPGQKSDSEKKVVIYYFHGTYRCGTCRKIESNIKLAVGTGFKKELTNGLIEIRNINVEAEKNRHYITDYRLHTRSVIVSLIENNKEISNKNLYKIWELFNYQEEFINYIQREVEDYLKK